MTFACIGAVDALHNTLDWVARGGEEETAWELLFSLTMQNTIWNPPVNTLKVLVVERF